MIKKILLIFVLCLIVLGVISIYQAYQYRENLRQQRQAAKAEQISVTLVEGWDNSDIGKYLEKSGISSTADFLNAEKNINKSAYSFLSDKPQAADLQGYIFPDTYFVLKLPLGAGTTSSQTIIKKALENFSQKVTPQMRQQAGANHLTLYQTLTLASIIERETGNTAGEKKTAQQLDDERKNVASVFYNRLNSGMPLQSDATIAYMLGSDRPPTAQDLTVDSPYNTYTNKGLTPGPICNPSLSSIKAALYPNQTAYLYFLTDPKSGQTIFSKTYDEHLKNVQKYLH